MKKPRIVLVGRPNVGKSTLFNRLVHSRVSITDATPGVTRDSVESDGELGGRALTFVDTGGYSLEGDVFAELVRSQCLAAAKDADVILLILDVTDLTPEDEEFADIMRTYNDRTIVVVNKVDSSKREQLLGDFYALGYPRLVPLSAAHGLGMEDLEEAVLSLLPADARSESDTIEEGAAGPGADGGTDAASSGEREEPTQPDGTVRLAILGKPNTGKSTLANRLLGRERSIVSDIAGTTRDIVGGSFTWKGREIEVLDTAGIRRKRSVTDSVEYYSVNRAVHAAEACDVAVLTVDAQDGLTDQDKKIAQIVVRRGKAVVIALNKWDTLEKIPNLLQAVKDRLSFVFPVLDYAPVVPLSATRGEGIDELLKKVMLVYRESTRRIDTGELNRKLEQWVTRTPPPVLGRGRLKLRYMTQVGVQPVTFVAFANRERGIPESYISYVKNSIRKDLGFAHVPVKLELRRSRSH